MLIHVFHLIPVIKCFFDTRVGKGGDLVKWSEHYVPLTEGSPETKKKPDSSYLPWENLFTICIAGVFGARLVAWSEDHKPFLNIEHMTSHTFY